MPNIINLKEKEEMIKDSIESSNLNTKKPIKEKKITYL